MIDKKLQILSRLVKELIGISLFGEIPSDEIRSLDLPVSNEDSLRGRINDIVNLLDRINKKEIDKYTNVKTKGSKESFICLLKKILLNEHNSIDENIDFPLGMIFLLRGFLTHRKNKNIKKASEFFEITLPIRDYAGVWKIVLSNFSIVLDQSIELLNSSILKKDFKQTEIDDQLLEIIKRKLILRFESCFEDDNIKKLLLYILSNKSVIDTDLSQLFKLNVNDIRALLLPLIPHILNIVYLDENATKIVINDFAVELLTDFYFGEDIK